MPKVKKQYSDLLPPLSTEEFDSLKADIKANGVQVPIVVDEEGVILDGHHRYKIDKKAPTRVVSGLSDSEKEAFAIRANLVRRNLSPDQKAEVREKQKALAFRLREEAPKRWTQNRVAEVIGVSREAVSKWFNRDSRSNGTSTNTSSSPPAKQPEPRPDARVKLSPIAKEKAVERVRGGESQTQVAADLGVSQKAISLAVQQFDERDRTEELKAKAVPVATGLYDVIVIDPPWPMEKIEREVRPNQAGFDYPTMTEGELSILDIPASDNSHIWLWTTHKFFPMAFRLLDAWSFKYVCTFVWHKPGGMQPVGLPQYNCEFALYARKGSPKFGTTKQMPTCFNAKRGRHSEKPKEFYDMVRRVTEGERLDMFSRRKIEGFDSWGNEAS